MIIRTSLILTGKLQKQKTKKSTENNYLNDFKDIALKIFIVVTMFDKLTSQNLYHIICNLHDYSDRKFCEFLFYKNLM